MSRPAKDRTEVAKLLTAAKGSETPWRVVEAKTGIIKTTREGWFRRDGNEPPLGQLVFLAEYLGVSAEDLVAAALEDYRASAAASVDPVVAEAAKVLPARPRERKRPRRSPPPHRGGRPSPEE